MAHPDAIADKAPTAKETVRTSISLPKEHYDILASLAEQNRVSVAWVVRDAVARYVEDRWPLLRA